jgi:hypothetical protein
MTTVEIKRTIVIKEEEIESSKNITLRSIEEVENNGKLNKREELV